MTPHELGPPKGRYKGTHKVLANARGRRGWNALCQSRPGPMRTCHIELADHPFPAFPRTRHHALKGKLKDFWEYEVGGGERVRYKRHSDGNPLVVYAGPAPSDTH